MRELGSVGIAEIWRTVLARFLILVGVVALPAIAVRAGLPGEILQGITSVLVATLAVLFGYELLLRVRSNRRARAIPMAATTVVVDAHVDYNLLRDLRIVRPALGRLGEDEALEKIVTLSFSERQICIWSGLPPTRVAAFEGVEVRRLECGESELLEKTYAALSMSVVASGEPRMVRFVLSRVGSAGIAKLDSAVIRSALNSMTGRTG